MPKQVATVTLDKRKLDDLVRTMPQALERWLQSVAVDAVTDIKKSFGTGPPGRLYRKSEHGQPGSKVIHVASTPGYPPNVDTGALRASIKEERVAPFHRRISDGVEYGIKLEEGLGRTGGALSARPFVGPVFKELERTIGDKLKNSDVFK